MLIKESFLQKEENDKIRMQIIRWIMEIYDQGSLRRILNLTMMLWGKEDEHPEDIVSIAESLSVSDLVHLLDVVLKMDMNQLAPRQMYEAFSKALDSYTGADKEEDDEE